MEAKNEDESRRGSGKYGQLSGAAEFGLIRNSAVTDFYCNHQRHRIVPYTGSCGAFDKIQHGAPYDDATHDNVTYVLLNWLQSLTTSFSCSTTTCACSDVIKLFSTSRLWTSTWIKVMIFL